MKTCPACRQALPDDALFCPIDGSSLAAAESDPLIGTVIGDRYVLLERVGQGNSGTIYRGEHVTLRQRIAIKLLHPQLSEDPAAVERFRQEAAALAQLSSSHIVRISDFGVAQDGRVFFAMEFLEGETIGAMLGREGRFKEERALGLLRQVGDALAEAHELGYVHRDIRPRNIFITKKGDKELVKLLDFGLAKLNAPLKGNATTLGTAGLGDARYLSPEQARGDQVDMRSDLYALALIAYEMVSGAPPFVGGGTLDVLTKHLEAQPVPLEQKVPEISKSFAGAVARALSKKARDRYPDLPRFLDALSGKAPVEDSAAEKVAAAAAALAAPAAPAAQPAPAKAEAARPAEAKRAEAPKPAETKPADAPKPESKPAPAAKVEAAKVESPKQPAKTDPEKIKIAAKPPSAGVQPVARKSDSPPLAEGPAGTLIGTGLTAKEVLEAAGAGTTLKGAGDTAESATTLPFQKVGPAKAEVAKAPVVVPGPKTGAVVPEAAATVLEANVPKAAVGKIPGDGGRPRSRTPSASEFAVPAAAYDAADHPAGQTGNWFAEGLAAEQELAHSGTSSGPLPAIYDSMDESISIRRGPSPSMIITAVVVVAAIVLFLIIFGFRDKTPETPGKLPVAGSGEPSSEPKKAKPAPKPEPKAVAKPEPKKAEPKPEPVAKPEPKPEPKAVAKAEPKPEPKAVAKPAPKVAVVAKPEPKKAEPKPLAKPEPKPKAKKPEPKAVAKPEPKPKAKKPEPKAVAKPEPKPKAKPGRDPAAAEAQVRAGRNALQRGDYSKAKEAFNKALELSPGNAAAHAGLGEVAFEQGQYGPAANQFKSAVRTAPRNARFLVMLGNAYFKSGKTKQAVDQYRKALASDPNNAEAKAGLQAAVRRLGGA